MAAILVVFTCNRHCIIPTRPPYGLRRQKRERCPACMNLLGGAARAGLAAGTILVRHLAALVAARKTSDRVTAEASVGAALAARSRRERGALAIGNRTDGDARELATVAAEVDGEVIRTIGEDTELETRRKEAIRVRIHPAASSVAPDADEDVCRSLRDAAKIIAVGIATCQGGAVACDVIAEKLSLVGRDLVRIKLGIRNPRVVTLQENGEVLRLAVDACHRQVGAAVGLAAEAVGAQAEAIAIPKHGTRERMGKLTLFDANEARVIRRRRTEIRVADSRRVQGAGTVARHSRCVFSIE